MNTKVSIKDNEILNHELQTEVDRVSDKYKDCNAEFEQIGEEPLGDLPNKDTKSETKVSDETIVNILSKM